MNRAQKTFLIPVCELLPSEITRIRREAIAAVVAMAATELKKSPGGLVVRDIRPYSDLHWCTDATAFDTALSVDSWCPTLDSSDAYEAYKATVSATYTTMTDSRWVVLTGVKDFRLAEATAVKQVINFLKFTVGGNDRAIWDLQGMEAYPNSMAAVSPAPVVIPQNTDYQIYILHAESDDGNAASDKVVYLVLDGFVVEPRGKVLSP